MSSHDALLSPVNVGGLQLNNRVVMAPMTRNQSPDNTPNDGNVEYYRRRAAGGVGLIVTEGTCVDHIAASGYPGVPYIHGEERLAGWKRVVDAVHQEGGKIAPQLWHVGGMRKRGVLPEGDVDGYAPSGMNVPGKVNRHTMTTSDIDDVIASLLVAEGFVGTEDIAESEVDELISIQGFDEGIATELRNRAIDFVNRETNRITEEMGQFTVADDLMAFAMLNPAMILTLAKNSILTLDDLADLDTEELVGFLNEHGITSEEKAGEIIMEARKHWFDDEEEEEEENTANETADTGETAESEGSAD